MKIISFRAKLPMLSLPLGIHPVFVVYQNVLITADTCKLKFFADIFWLELG